MNPLFRRDVYIRLADDDTAFTCTVKYGKLFATRCVIALAGHLKPGVLDEQAPALARIRPSRGPAPEER